MWSTLPQGRSGGSLDPEGPVAAEMAGLWWLMLGLGTAVFALFLFLLLRGLFRRPADVAPSPRLWLVGAGFVLPAVVILVVFGFTVAAMRSLPDQGGRDALVIEVTGQQWWWDVTYPEEGVRTANEIHVPVDRRVELHLRSADVIHSFWIPAWAGKLDLLPERTNVLVLEADRPGTHRGACAEFCGLQHAKMGLIGIAESADDFRRWVERQQEPAADPEGDAETRGMEVFLEAGCAECHTIRGTTARGMVGPDLTHVASRLTLAAGTFPNTPEHMAGWVSDPQGLKTGVEMPNVPLTPDELEALVSYLEALE